MGDFGERSKVWKYKNTILLLVSIPLVLLLARTPFIARLLANAGTLGLPGAFILGIFFVSTFTIAPASIVLYHLAEVTDPVLLALAAGLGGVVGDFIIFRFYKDRIFLELEPLLKSKFAPLYRKIRRSRALKWIIPVVGAAIVASPFPDEIGIGLMGLSHLKNREFIVIIFLLDTLGMYAFASLAHAMAG